jgi:hypothetical protein
LATGFVVELKNYLYQAVAALVCEDLAEVEGDFMRLQLWVLTASKAATLGVNAGHGAAEERWSQREDRQ